MTRSVWLVSGMSIAVVIFIALGQVARTEMATSLQGMGAISGKITALDPAQHRITLKVGRSTKQFTVSKDADITSGQELRRLEELKPGEDVQVEFDTVQNQRFVKTLKVKEIQPMPMNQPSHVSTDIPHP